MKLRLFIRNRESEASVASVFSRILEDSGLRILIGDYGAVRRLQDGGDPLETRIVVSTAVNYDVANAEEVARMLCVLFRREPDKPLGKVQEA